MKNKLFPASSPDEPPFSEGSGIGIGLFLLTLAVSVVMVVMATRLQRQGLDVERQQATEMQHTQPAQPVQQQQQAQQNGGFRYQPEQSNTIGRSFIRCWLTYTDS